MRNNPEAEPVEGAVVTYSRLKARGKAEPAERREPVLDAREVPYANDDLRAYDPDRVDGGPVDASIDDFDDEPRRGRGRRGVRGAILIGAVALAAALVVLAYAYGVITRVDGPPAATTATAPAAGDTRGTLPADDAARSVPATGEAPAVQAVRPATATQQAPPAQASAEPPTPKTRPTPAPQPAPVAPVAATGSAGAPMDGDGGVAAQPAQPALVAPVSATATPAAPEKAAPAAEPRRTATTRPAEARPAEAQPTSARAADAKAPGAAPVDSNDALMSNIERLLQRDETATGATTQPAAAAPAQPVAAAPTPLAAGQPLSDPNALPPLPDPNAPAAMPPANVAPQPSGGPIPPADIPNVGQ